MGRRQVPDRGLFLSADRHRGGGQEPSADKETDADEIGKVRRTCRVSGRFGFFENRCVALVWIIEDSINPILSVKPGFLVNFADQAIIFYSLLNAHRAQMRQLKGKYVRINGKNVREKSLVDANAQNRTRNDKTYVLFAASRSLRS